MRVGDDQSGCLTPAVDMADAILGVAPTIGGGGKSGTFHFSAAGRTGRYGFAKEIFARAEKITKQPPPVVRPIAAAGEIRARLLPVHRHLRHRAKELAARPGGCTKRTSEGLRDSP